MRKKILISIFVVLTMFYINRAKQYQAKQIDIFGNIVTSSSQIKKCLNSTNMYNMSIKKTKQNILKLPWIKNCVIKKNWPNKIIILIEEKLPIFETKNSYITTNGEKISKNHGLYGVHRIKFDGDFVETEIEKLFSVLNNYESFLNQIDKIYRKRYMRFDFLIDNTLLKCLDNEVNKCIIRYLTLPKNTKKYEVIDFRHPHRTLFYNI